MDVNMQLKPNVSISISILILQTANTCELQINQNMSVLRLYYTNINGWATLLFTLNTLGVIIVFKHNMVQSTNETSVAFKW